MGADRPPGAAPAAFLAQRIGERRVEPFVFTMSIEASQGKQGKTYTVWVEPQPSA